MTPSQPKVVGVIGAGQMGNGIAHVASLAGYRVILSDRTRELADAALGVIDVNMGRQIRAGRLAENDKQQALKRIEIVDGFEAFHDADLVVEAISENVDLKRETYRALCPQLRPETILASNTSSISITKLAAATDRPEKFIGVHFMNPVPVMELIELIRGIATDEETFAVAREFSVSLGKTVVVAEDFPAFIVNRVLMPMINEGIYALYEGVGEVEAIDAAMRLGARHPLGPLELADFIGLDTCLAIMQVLHEGLADTKYRPCPLLVKYVEAGWLGRKTQRGFYDYRGDRPVPSRAAKGAGGA